MYWELLNGLGLPNYLLLDNELVIITDIQKKKRKNGAKMDQVYYTTDTGLSKHASFFRKLSKEDITRLIRDNKLKELGL